MRTGIIFSKQYFYYYSYYPDATDTRIKNLDGIGNTETYQGYLQLKYKLNDKLHVNGGVHYLQFALNGDYSVEPGIGIKYFLNSSQTISAGYGLHSRHDMLMRYFTRIQDEYSRGILLYR